MRSPTRAMTSGGMEGLRWQATASRQTENRKRRRTRAPKCSTGSLRGDGLKQILDRIDHGRAVGLEREGEHTVGCEPHLVVVGDELEQLVRIDLCFLSQFE